MYTVIFTSTMTGSVHTVIHAYDSEDDARAAAKAFATAPNNFYGVVRQAICLF